MKELENELLEEKQKNLKLSNDLKASVGLLKNVNTINMSKDIQIDHLNKKLKYTSSPALSNEDQLFKEFSSIFDQNQLKNLRSISSGKSKDSTFVMMAMRFLYPDPTVLNNRSVTGKMRNKIKKTKMTPRKMEIITKMMSQRVNSERGIDSMLVSQRIERIKKLVRDAISKLKIGCSNKTVTTASQSYATAPEENLHRIIAPPVRPPSSNAEIHGKILRFN